MWLLSTDGYVKKLFWRNCTVEMQQKASPLI